MSPGTIVHRPKAMPDRSLKVGHHAAALRLRYLIECLDSIQ